VALILAWAPDISLADHWVRPGVSPILLGTACIYIRVIAVSMCCFRTGMPVDCGQGNRICYILLALISNGDIANNALVMNVWVTDIRRGGSCSLIVHLSCDPTHLNTRTAGPKPR
jgi:hypothetical protein